MVGRLSSFWDAMFSDAMFQWGYLSHFQINIFSESVDQGVTCCSDKLPFPTSFRRNVLCFLGTSTKKRRWIRFCWKLPVEVFYCYTLVDFLHRSPIKIRYRHLNECLINPGFINPYGLCLRNSHCNNSGGIIVLMSMGCGAFAATLLANMSHPCIWSNYDPSVIAVSCAAFDALSERSKNWTKNTPFWQRARG